MPRKKEADYKAYDRIEVLVHPFFVLEHAKRFRRGGQIKGTSERQMLKNYAVFDLIANWKKRIEQVKKDPHAIMIIAGPRAMETDRNNSFFEGSLTKEKLQSMNQTYQDFLHEAKAELGNKLMYVTQGIWINQKDRHYVGRQLQKRGYLPTPTVRINAYGEYYGQCVEQVTTALKSYVKELQAFYFPKLKTKVTRRKLYVAPGKKKGVLSLDRETAFVGEAVREHKKSGKITEAFFRKKRRFQAGVDAKKAATNLSTLLKKTKSRRKR